MPSAADFQSTTEARRKLRTAILKPLLIVTPSSALKIGFVTSSEHRQLTEDDLVLARALGQRGATVTPVVWTEVLPDQHGCHLLLLRSCWDYHLDPQAFEHWFTTAAKSATVINPPHLVRWNMDKRYLKDVAAGGFSVPKTILLEAGQQADLGEAIRAGQFTSAVMTPAISLSAYETYLLTPSNAAELQPRLNQLLTTRAMLLQEFVAEIQTEGEWSLIFIGGEYGHTLSKLPRNGDFRVQHEHGGTYRPAEPSPAMLKTASEILARFAPDALYARVDLVPREQGIFLMELELIDPLLHFELAPAAADRMAELLTRDQPTHCEAR